VSSNTTACMKELSHQKNNCHDISSEDGDEIQDLNDPATPAAESGRTRLFDLITLLVLFYAGVTCERSLRTYLRQQWLEIGSPLMYS